MSELRNVLRIQIDLETLKPEDLKEITAHIVMRKIEYMAEKLGLLAEEDEGDVTYH